MKIPRINILLFLLFFSKSFLFSQNKESTKDLQTWHNLELKYKVLKKIDLAVEGGVRLIDNSKTVSKYFTDFSVTKKHNNLFSYSLGYRYLLNKNNDFLFEKKNRFYGDVRFKKKLYDRFLVNLRTRLQSQIDTDFDGEQNIKNKLRKKIKLNYYFKQIDLDVFSALEVFYFFHSGFEKTRYMIGVQKSLAKKLDLGLNLMYQDELLDPLESFFAFRTTVSYRIEVK
tara:strand:- start:432 stop:1112 length:681 start_codon:yes stop_codon:yes gene_type:complete